MKYKILVNGGSENPALLKDFFTYTSSHFDILSTTAEWTDVANHFKFFKPDVYVIFMDSAYSESVATIPKLKINTNYNEAPIMIVGKAEDCKDFEENHPNTASLIIRRPISPDNLALSIISYLEKDFEKDNDTERKKRILVVDDDRLMLKTIKAALEDKYDVTVMVNGVMVEKFLMQNKPDLIILDYEMPIMTGAEVFRTIKSNARFSRIPVCFLTGVSDRDKVQEIMSLKPRGYLLKPINMDMLLSTVANLTQ